MSLNIKPLADRVLIEPAKLKQRQHRVLLSQITLKKNHKKEKLLLLVKAPKTNRLQLKLATLFYMVNTQAQN
jgi:co-chaperonin GroES (HSP10)